MGVRILINGQPYTHRSLYDLNPDCIFMVCSGGTIRGANAAAEAVTGWTTGELIGMKLVEFCDPKSAAAWLEFQERADHSGPAVREVAFRHREGRIINLLFKVIPFGEEEAGFRGWYVVGRDITARKAFEKHLMFQAFHDSLTRLPNRTMFMQRLREALDTVEEGYTVGVLYIDLDGFKLVNDSIGHSAGDALLIEVAERLRQFLPLRGIVARLGGDEFAMLLPACTTADAMCTASQILEAMEEPLYIAGQQLVMSPSIGLAFGSDTRDADELVQFADGAMYEAKRLGKARFTVFDPSMNQHAMERFRLEMGLRTALDRDQFTLYYQPIVDLRTGVLTGIEALLRWDSPERGLVMPGEFISLSEENGLIVPVGQWVLQQACSQLRLWQEELGVDRLEMSVNISMRQLKEPQFVEDVKRVLAETGLRSENLKLEITESLLAQDLQSTLEKLRQLKALGVRLAIDDFGKGYSSFTYLRQLPVDLVKIDCSFVSGLGRSHEDEAIVQAMISVSKSLGLVVTGEGIETGEQLERLRRFSCDGGQGFFISPPLPAGEMKRLLSKWEALPPGSSPRRPRKPSKRNAS